MNGPGSNNTGLRAAALLLALLPALALAQVAPYTAHYEVRRNGSAMGESLVTLKPAGAGRSEFSSSTSGSHGLAALIGANIEERSLVAWHDGVPESVSWSLSQKVAMNSKEKSLRVDAAGRRIELRDRDRSFSPPYKPGVVDRHAVTLALMHDLAAGRSGELRYLVPDKDELQPWVFRTGASERLDTPMGAQRVLRVERIRESGNGRSTTMWLAQDHNFVPIRMVQKEPDGETIEMRITSLR
jgi:hypothetical protein